MSQDDPFAPLGDSDRTILRPSPGGRRRSGLTGLQPVPVAPPPVDAPPAPHTAAFGRNPIAGAALSLLSLVARLRHTAVHPAVGELQQKLVLDLRGFENGILQQGVAQEQARIASYALCALLDETVLNTPWGAQSFWGHQSLLAIFHRETWGGEKFFQFLDGLVRQPARNLDLIELFWLCLSLGFEGRYRIVPDGLRQLEQVRAEVYQTIRRLRGEAERELSPHWEGLKDVRNPLVRFLPLWVIAAAAGAALLFIYLGFVLVLNGVADPKARDLYGLAKAEAAPVYRPAVSAAPPPPAAKAARFKPLLATEIARGLVDVVDDRILRVRNSFASGSDRLKPEFLPLLDKIGRELKAGGDRALVTGHTDDQPIFSTRFPSNFDLSTARALHVASLLEAALGIPGRVEAEGRADYEPLAPNDSPEHRAVNRRVDILVR
jgi:type VI secretion system protein ImpK